MYFADLIYTIIVYTNVVYTFSLFDGGFNSLLLFIILYFFYLKKSVVYSNDSFIFELSRTTKP